MMTSDSGPARPAKRWITDAVIAVAVTALQVGGSYAITTAHPAKHLAVPPAGYAVLVVGGLALTARRRYPTVVLGIALATALAAAALGAPLAYLALIVAFFTAVLAGQRTAAIASLFIGYLGSVLPGLVTGRGPSLTFALSLLAWLLVLLTGAELLRLRRQRAVQLERSREDELRRRAMAERLAIARDLHDVVAHNISVINVQANTALHLMDRQPERARAALTAIHDVSKQALAELRSVLGVLREGEEQPPLTPGPGLHQLPSLIASAQAAGLAVDLIEQGEPHEPPAAAGVAAYRIVQEALTNAARHAPGSAALVSISYRVEALTVQVDNDNGGYDGKKPADLNGAGTGITGMTERAQALGGTLAAGPRAGGGFQVVATLPLRAER